MRRTMSASQGSGVVIVDAVRTPTGRFQGALSGFTAPELGARVIRALKERNDLRGDEVDEVVMGCVIQAGLGQAPARQAALKGGLAASVPAVTVNKVCGSGLKAVIQGAQALKLGDAQIVIAGGMESMSNAPFLLQGARKGFRYGDQRLIDAMIYDGLWCAFEQHHMGNAAEYTARKSGISREEQDRYALESHRKAVRATEEGAFRDELVPLETEDGLLDRDETPRPDTSLEKLARLKPVFDPQGTVTAGNAPGLNDGAAALLLTTLETAKAKGWRPLARIEGYAVAAVEPLELFYAPVHSTRRLLEKLGMRLDDFDLIEVNEAFAAQVLADGKELEWDWARVNVHGGAIALGHPIGASGARILTTLVWALRRYEKEWGLATICMGGGMGLSLAVRRLDG